MMQESEQSRPSLKARTACLLEHLLQGEREKRGCMESDIGRLGSHSVCLHKQQQTREPRGQTETVPGIWASLTHTPKQEATQQNPFLASKKVLSTTGRGFRFREGCYATVVSTARKALRTDCLY